MQTSSERSRKLMAGAISGLVALVFIPLAIEYVKLKWLSDSDDLKSIDTYIWSSTQLVSVVIFTGSIGVWLRAAWIGLFSTRFFREQLAACVVVAILMNLVSLFLATILNLTPWRVIQTYIGIGSARGLSASAVSLGEYIPWVFALYILYLKSQRTYETWRGYLSTRQFDAKERGESFSLVPDGFDYLHYRLDGGEALEAKSEYITKSAPPRLEITNDNSTWAEQARQLVLLANRELRIDSEKGWIPSVRCWLGTNLDCNESVVLVPRNKMISPEDSSRVIEYLKTYKSDLVLRIGEIILVLEEEPTEELVCMESFPARQKCIKKTELLDKLIDFSDYFRDIRTRAALTKFPETDLSLCDVYVPSQVADLEGKTQGEDLRQFITTWVNENSLRQACVLGEYGQGKSTSMLMFAHDCISGGFPRVRRVPILIELRGMSPRNLTPLQLLGSWGAKYNINPQALMRLNIEGKLLIIFEGFDEMELSGDTEKRLSHFKALWQFCYPKAKILLTGRPNFFLDDLEMRRSLGIDIPSLHRPYCEVMRLLPFDLESIRSAVDRYDKNLSGQIVSAAESNERFRDIVSRPSLLHYVVHLWKRENLGDRVEELTSAEVIELFLWHCFTRQGKKEGDFGGFSALTATEREYFMCGIACYMASRRLSNQISGSEVRQLVNDLIEHAPLQLSRPSTAMTNETTEPLRSRVAENSGILEHIQTDVRTCGVLVDDPAAPGVFRFGHKSFMEYLVAQTLFGVVCRDSYPQESVLMITTGLSLDRASESSVVVEFFSDLVSKKSSSRNLAIDDRLSLCTGIFNWCVFKRQKVGLLASFSVRFLSILFLCVFPPFVNRLFHTRKFALVHVSIIVCLTLLQLLVSAGLLLGWFGVRRDEALISDPLLASTIGVLTCTMIIFAELIKRYLQVWIRICSVLEIPQSTMHKVLGTSYVPFFRKLKFRIHLLED